MSYEDKPGTGDHTGLSIDALMKSRALSDSLKARISEADENQDGILSMDELVGVIRSEQSAVQQQRLFRRLLIFMAVMMVLAVAALVGCVYAIVDLTQQVKDDNDVMISKDSEQPMAVGSARALVSNFSSLVGEDGLNTAMGLERLILPGDDLSKTKIYTVSKVELGQPEDGATIYAASGETFEVDATGEIFAVNQTFSSSDPLGSQGSGGTRRLLAVGVVGGPAPAMTTSGLPTHTPLGLSGDLKSRKAACDKWIKIAQDKMLKTAKESRTFVFPSDMPMQCRMQLTARNTRV